MNHVGWTFATILALATQVYIQTLAFQKFLETGQLLPEVPSLSVY